MANPNHRGKAGADKQREVVGEKKQEKLFAKKHKDGGERAWRASFRCNTLDGV